DLSNIYCINDGNNKYFIPISHKDLSKINNKEFKEMINNLYIDKVSHKKISSSAKSNTKYFIKNTK
ncbi:MAG: hypothetical protein K6E20_02950, partial [Acholeplasmatales bacterium]|nr:hypothetical protein [Acholeplasmatales bacterium]